MREGGEVDDARAWARDGVTVVVPTFNEAPNMEPLLRALAALPEPLLEVIVVDDSSDGTAAEVERVAAHLDVPVTCLQRDVAEGGLSGAVVLGLARARGRWAVVMDGDLQHPPATVPHLLERIRGGDLDVVLASRYAERGESTGLSSAARHAVSTGSTLVTKAMFPRRLHTCTDPMTGFFVLDRSTVDATELRPRGFKILLEVLVRRRRRFAEVPFTFGTRHAGRSKASVRQGAQFLWQLAGLRFGRMSSFALIGALGAVLNVAIVAALVSAGASVLLAAIVAAEVTIVGNFLLQERFAFGDLRHEARPAWARFGASFAFNNVESLIRIPIVVWLVDVHLFTSAVATAVTLAVAFVVRFVFHSLVVYAPRRAPTADQALDAAVADDVTTGPR